MKKETVEIFSDKINKSIIRMPNRQFPGFVIQGDNLHKLYSHALEIVGMLEGNPNKDSFLNALSLAERFESFLEHYEYILKEHNIDFPFNRDHENSTARYQHYWKDENV